MSAPCQFVFSPPEPPDPWCLTHRRSANECKTLADQRIATLEAVLREARHLSMTAGLFQRIEAALKPDEPGVAAALKPLPFTKQGVAKCPVCEYSVCRDTDYQIDHGVVVLSCGHTPKLEAWLLARINAIDERVTAGEAQT